MMQIAQTMIKPLLNICMEDRLPTAAAKWVFRNYCSLNPQLGSKQKKHVCSLITTLISQSTYNFDKNMNNTDFQT